MRLQQYLTYSCNSRYRQKQSPHQMWCMRVHSRMGIQPSRQRPELSRNSGIRHIYHRCSQHSLLTHGNCRWMDSRRVIWQMYRQSFRKDCHPLLKAQRQQVRPPCRPAMQAVLTESDHHKQTMMYQPFHRHLKSRLHF